jgi:hypothetical protein
VRSRAGEDASAISMLNSGTSGAWASHQLRMRPPIGRSTSCSASATASHNRLKSTPVPIPKLIGEEYEILGCQVARGARGKWTAAKPAHAAVENAHPGGDGGRGIGQAQDLRIVQMDGQPVHIGTPPHLLQQLPNAERIGMPNRIGDCQLVYAHVPEPLRIG